MSTHYTRIVLENFDKTECAHMYHDVVSLGGVLSKGQHQENAREIRLVRRSPLQLNHCWLLLAAGVARAPLR